MTSEDQQLIEEMIKEAVSSHVHGVNAGKVWGKYLRNAPQTTMTTADGSSADATYSANEQSLINNHTTRINEIETILTNLNLI